MGERKGECPNASNHTPQPEGYLQWHAWAARMIKSHKQTKCPSCGLWKIWVRKQSKMALP